MHMMKCQRRRSSSSILGPLLLLIYINNFSDDLSSKIKLLSDSTSLFNVVHDINTSASKLNSHLEMVSNWAFQWKMSFNLNPSKQVQEVIFSRKLKEGGGGEAEGFCRGHEIFYAYIDEP